MLRHHPREYAYGRREERYKERCPYRQARHQLFFEGFELLKHALGVFVVPLFELYDLIARLLVELVTYVYGLFFAHAPTSESYS